MARGLGNRSQRLFFEVALLALSALSCQADPSDWLDAHNAARQAVAAGIPDLTWDYTLQAYATNWANNQASTAECAIAHSGGPYGENLYRASFDGTPVDAVGLWVDEQQSHTCATDDMCGHYTQVVWANAVSVGCGTATCPDGGTFVVCSYNPQGNYVGEWPCRY